MEAPVAADVNQAESRDGPSAIVIDRDFIVRLKLTSTPCSRSEGASRRSSFPSITGVLGQRGEVVALCSLYLLKCASHSAGDIVSMSSGSQ